jgi:RNA polymerase sigma-70 factor, ECF subfamily
MTFDLRREIVAVLPRVRRFALSLCRSPDEADDLLQAACERALAAAPSFEPGSRIDSWMYRIVRNLWYDSLRRRQTRGTEIEPDAVLDLADPRARGGADDRILLGEVGAIVQTLPPDQREVLLLVCVEELSYREAAEVLDIPIGTVMSRLARARKKIADAMGLDDDAARSRSDKGDVA